MFVQEEGRWVRREHSRVEDQDEDNPVPERLEGAVVEKDPPSCLGNLEFILRKYIRLQREYLNIKDASVT